MQTTKIVAGVLFAGAAFNAYEAYQAATQFNSHPLADPMKPPPTGAPVVVTPESCMTVRMAENQAFRSSLWASGLALGGLYLWMRP